MNAVCRWSAALGVIALSGALVACPGDVPPGGGLSFDNGVDGGPGDGLPVLLDGVRDVSHDRAPPDGGSPDTGTPDTQRDSQPVDLPVPDLPPPACAVKGGNGTLALYPFEKLTGGKAENAIDKKKYPGTLNSVVPTAGRTGCGQAALFDGNSAYIEVADAKEFDLPVGSVDFWVRFDKPGPAGLISRDASGNDEPGHFTIKRFCTGGLRVRLQTSNGDRVRCTPPVPNGVWLHVGVNFGQNLEIYVNGKLGTVSGKVPCGAPTGESCGQPGPGMLPGGTGGNNEPWVFGANTNGSDEGKATPLHSYLMGALDSVRISQIVRPFKTP